MSTDPWEAEAKRLLDAISGLIQRHDDWTPKGEIVCREAMQILGQPHEPVTTAKDALGRVVNASDGRCLICQQPLEASCHQSNEDVADPGDDDGDHASALVSVYGPDAA